jgi:hypothetical protein
VAEALLISMQSMPDELGPGDHLHPCPECYERQPCRFWCSVFYDEDADREGRLPCGSHLTCDDCLTEALVDAIVGWLR